MSVTKNTISRKKLLLLLACAAVGVLLMIFGGSIGGEVADENAELESLDPEKYAKEIEERVEELCNKIDGVSSTYAVVTLKGGYRAIYASDSQSGSSLSKHQTVIIGSGSSQKALLIGYENPEIAGIGIVCKGGDDAVARENIISVISSAFDISTNKIFVTGA